MSILSVNGLELPISVDSLSCTIEEVGETTRAEDGSLIIDRRAEKRVYDFECSPMAAQAALFLRDVLLGKGDVYAFDSHLYSSRGRAVSTVGALSATQVNFGAKSLKIASGGDDATFAYPGGAGGTMIAWGYQSSWLLRVASWRSGASGSPSYSADVTAGGTITSPSAWDSLFSSGGNADFTLQTSAADLYLDDVWVIPRSLEGVPTTIRDAWLQGIAALALPKGPAPRLVVTGDIVDPSVLSSGTASLTARGEVTGLQVLPLYSGGAISKTQHVLSGRLTEV
ncbi:MAG: hypothetical protein AMXMBFR56_72560 [Polyangiaceae bacterium]